jgi:hypothetical protein
MERPTFGHAVLSRQLESEVALFEDPLVKELNYFFDESVVPVPTSSIPEHQIPILDMFKRILERHHVRWDAKFRGRNIWSREKDGLIWICYSDYDSQQE